MDRIKILVVDDESRMRKLVHDFLSKHDFDVIEAGQLIGFGILGGQHDHWDVRSGTDLF